MSPLDHLLHGLAFVALKALPPTAAYGIVVRAGSFLPQRRSPEAIRHAAKRLRLGTCLSRAMTVSARAPGSEVVIGVQPPGAFGAHAWVEVAGAPLWDTERHGAEIARLRRRGPHEMETDEIVRDDLGRP